MVKPCGQGATKSLIYTTVFQKQKPPRLMLSGETCRQMYTAKVTHAPHLPEAARKLLESYLRLADWNHLLRVGEDSVKTFNWATSPEIIE